MATYNFQNVLVISFGFFFVMGGYMPCQSFSSTLLNFACLPVGEISIGIIYAFLAIGSLVAPAVIGKYGVRSCMFYSSLAYGTFAASVAYIALPVVMVTSICIGLFGAFLNIGGGVALADCTNDSNRGLYSGIFNAFNQGSIIPGNVLAMFVLDANTTASALPRPCGKTVELLLVPGWSVNDSSLFMGCSAFCFLGTAILWLFRSPSGGHVRPTTSLGGCASLKRIFDVSVSKDGIPLIVPLLMYSGVSNGFWSGMFTRQLPSSWVGSTMIMLGGGEIIGGFLFGKTIDGCGTNTATVMLVPLQTTALVVAHIANLNGDQHLFWVSAVLLGVCDCGANTLAYAVLSKRYAHTSDDDEANTVVVEELNTTTEHVNNNTTKLVNNYTIKHVYNNTIQHNTTRDNNTIQQYTTNAIQQVTTNTIQHVNNNTIKHITTSDNNVIQRITIRDKSIQPVSITDDDHAHDKTPLLAKETMDKTKETMGSPDRFNSRDGFGAFFFYQSLTIAALFFVMPLWVDESTGISSPTQFFWEEAGTFAFLLLAVVCVFVDSCTTHN